MSLFLFDDAKVRRKSECRIISPSVLLKNPLIIDTYQDYCVRAQYKCYRAQCNNKQFCRVTLILTKRLFYKVCQLHKLSD